MFGNAKIHNSNVWKRQNSQFQCLEKEKSRIPILELPKFQSLEKPKFTAPMFEKAKIKELQCL